MDEDYELDIYSNYYQSTKTQQTSSELTAPAPEEDNFFSSFFGANGAGTSLVNFAGSIGLGFLSNRAKQIEGKYNTELKKLSNENNLTLSEYQNKLAQINASMATELKELSNERARSSLIIIGIVVVVLGAMGTAVVFALKGK